MDVDECDTHKWQIAGRQISIVATSGQLSKECNIDGIAEYFKINEATGQILIAKSGLRPNYECGYYFKIDVIVEDTSCKGAIPSQDGSKPGKGIAVAGSVRIYINDVNDPPYFVGIDSSTDGPSESLS